MGSKFQIFLNYLQRPPYFDFYSYFIFVIKYLLMGQKYEFQEGCLRSNIILAYNTSDLIRERNPNNCCHHVLYIEQSLYLKCIYA